jgi:membrane-associated phospholipid phosphatase
MYMLHFITPMIVGFVLWIANRELFHRYSVAFAVVAIAGYITWVIYPSVPPWLAAQPLVHVGHIYLRPWAAASKGYPGGIASAWDHSHVYLPHVKNLFNFFIKHWYNGYNGELSFGFLHGHVDQVGAIPSEHAAFPMLCFFFLRRQFGRPAYLGLVYVAGLSFSVMYLGQHYFIDILVGFAYAWLSYVFAIHGLPRLMRAFALWRAGPPTRPALVVASDTKSGRPADVPKRTSGRP